MNRPEIYIIHIIKLQFHVQNSKINYPTSREGIAYFGNMHPLLTKGWTPHPLVRMHVSKTCWIFSHLTGFGLFSCLIVWLSVTTILSTIFCHEPWYNLFHVSSPFFIKTKMLYYIILFNNSTIIYIYKTINSDCTSFISYQLNSYLFVSSKLYVVEDCFPPTLLTSNSHTTTDFSKSLLELLKTLFSFLLLTLQSAASFLSHPLA